MTRQSRFGSLDKWGVSGIILSLTVALQLALCVFFAGLILLLWTINHYVAWIITSLVVACLTGVLVTALLPVFDLTCPYKSPLGWALNVAACVTLRPAGGMLTALSSWTSRTSPLLSRLLRRAVCKDWLALEIMYQKHHPFATTQQTVEVIR